MVKARFSAAEIAVISRDLRTKLVNSRIGNIYDLDPRILLFKFGSSDRKDYMLVEMGVRVHTTKFDREKPQLPSPFVVKLRKHLRARRLEDVSQVGTDRVIRFTFFSVVMYLEFYAKGNVILCARDTLQILAVMRPLEGFRVGDIYKEDILQNDPSSLPPIPPTSIGYLYPGEATYELVAGQQPEQTLPSFVEAVDAFFSRLDSQRTQDTQTSIETKAEKKLSKTQLEQKNRMAGLERGANECERRAKLIELNHAKVDECLEVVRSALSQGIDWTELKRIFKEQRRSGNPIALVIHSLKLEQSRIALELDDDTGTVDGGVVDVSLDRSALANAEAEYEERKKLLYKLQKTKEYEGLVLRKNQEKVRKRSEREQQERAVGSVRAKRQRLWFEKFDWFLTSEHYLVIAGRDAQQNEVVVKRYLRPVDVYVHADIFGAASCVVRNRGGVSVPIPESSLREAAAFAAARSSAWDARVSVQAWWVYAHQVSKTAPSGEYLTTGAFVIRGQKHFVQPQPLDMGFTVMFRTVNKKHDFVPPAVVLVTDASLQLDVENDEAEEVDNVDNADVQDDDDGMNFEDDEDDAEDAVSDEDTDRRRVQTKSASSESKPTEEKVEVIVHMKGLPGKPKKGMKVEKMTAKERKKLEQEKKQQEQEQRKTKGSVRGKHGKRQKMKDRYADQSDEERELMMAYLGNPLKSKQSRQQDAKEKEQISQIRTLPEVVAAPLVTVSSTADHRASDSEEQTRYDSHEQTDGSLSRQTSSQYATVTDNADIPEDDAEDVELDEDEVAADSDEDESAAGDAGKEEEDESTVLDYLTGTPAEDDEFLFVLPMVAPYAVIYGNRYKARLSPGALKRGKAVRECISAWLRDAQVDVHRELIKNLNEMDCSHQMLSNVKVQILAGKEQRGGRSGDNRSKDKKK
jgi:predicted ribosome quality control (RQC) complex YloA/Tae2 family protein